MSAELRLVYVFVGGMLKQKSVQNKITCQIKAFRENGIDAHGWFFNSLEGDEASGAYNEFATKYPLPKYTKQHRFFQSHYSNQFYFEYVADFMGKHSDKFDLIFLRQNGNGKGWERITEEFGDRTLMYVPSNRIRETFCERKYAEGASTVSTILSWYEYLRFWIREKRYQRNFLSKLKGVVTFTTEFGNILQRSSKKPLNLIYNRDGVDTDSVHVRSCKKRDSEAIQLIFLKGSNQEQKWAGLDRLIRSIEAFPDLQFELFITGNADRSPERYGRSFVTLTGRLPEDELEQLIDNVDLGVSNLANYLIHFSETTNMKSRDYYSRGLPFIQSNTMPDIEGTEAEQFYLRVPNDESLIDMDLVHRFAMKMRSDPSHPKKMHDFAAANLDWNVTVGELAESIKSMENS